jgi:hypothetical protein
MPAPALRPGDVVAGDDLGSRKVAGVREASEARGAWQLHPPPRGPGPNTVEPAFRKLERPLRTADAPQATIGAALGRFALRRMREPPAPVRTGAAEAMRS